MEKEHLKWKNKFVKPANTFIKIMDVRETSTSKYIADTAPAST